MRALPCVRYWLSNKMSTSTLSDGLWRMTIVSTSIFICSIPDVLAASLLEAITTVVVVVRRPANWRLTRAGDCLAINGMINIHADSPLGLEFRESAPSILSCP